MVIASYVLLALAAAGLGALARWGLARLGAPEIVAFWLGLALALAIILNGPIHIG